MKLHRWTDWKADAYIPRVRNFINRTASSVYGGLKNHLKKVSFPFSALFVQNSEKRRIVCSALVFQLLIQANVSCKLSTVLSESFLSRVNNLYVPHDKKDSDKNHAEIAACNS